MLHFSEVCLVHQGGQRRLAIEPRSPHAERGATLAPEAVTATRVSTQPIILRHGVSVIIPVYCSQGTLHALVDRLATVLDERRVPFEIILVNDGSSDRSWSTIEDILRVNAMVRGIDLLRNYGQHNALLCGIREAAYDVTVTMDDDLQHPPEEIGRLLDKVCEGYDVVYGTRQQRQYGLWRNAATFMTKLALSKVVGARTARDVSPLRAFRTEIRGVFADYRNPFVNIDVLLAWGATRYGTVAMRHDPRLAGHSNYTLSKLVTHTVNVLTGFSTFPLQIASGLGFGFAFFGLLVLAFVLIRYLVEGGSVPGFAFLASIITIFSGAQLVVLGIMGEYLARVYHRISDRPTYVKRKDSGPIQVDPITSTKYIG